MKAFFDALRTELGSLTHDQVRGFEIILAASADLPLRHRAYILATAWHETAFTMQPVRETLAKTDASAVNILERAWAEGKLKWVRTPYWRFDSEGKTFLGRGYVQLTHKSNYAKAGEKLGVDLVADPNRAMNPELAAMILVRGMREGWFTGKKMADFQTYADMRRVVNGTDRAAQIARYATSFEIALQALEEAGVEPPEPEKPEKQPCVIFKSIRKFLKGE